MQLSVHPSHCHPVVLRPVHPQQCYEVQTHLGKVLQGRRCAARCVVQCAVQGSVERCSPGRRAKGSWRGGEGLDLPVHPQHQWPPWKECRGFTSVGWDWGG